MDESERAMLLEVYRGHVTAADAIARRLGLVSRETKLRQHVAANFDALLAARDNGADLSMLLAAIRRSRDEYTDTRNRS